MENKVSGSDDLVFPLLCRGWMLTQWRYVNDDWSSRPPLSRPGPASSRWDALASTKQSFGQNRRGLQSYNLRVSGSRHFLINPTLDWPAICVHCTGQVLWVPLPLSVVSLPPNAIFKPHHTQWHGPQPPEQLWGSQWRGEGAASNVFRYSEDNLMRGSPSSFSYFLVITRRVRQTYYDAMRWSIILSAMQATKCSLSYVIVETPGPPLLIGSDWTNDVKALINSCSSALGQGHTRELMQSIW